MRKTIIGVILALSFVGCSDFLEEKSQSEVRPSTLSDMERILKGEAYFRETEGKLFNYATDIFTDDIKCNMYKNVAEKARKEKFQWRFIWDQDMFNAVRGYEDLSFWSVPYTRIKGCNLILDYIGTMTGDAGKRAYLQGEAYTMRGFYYMMLVNFFGKPYNEGNPAENPGVPLKLISGVTGELFLRNSVEEVYKQIETDLKKGAALMKANRMELVKTRVNHLTAYALLTRMYLYMEDWDNVIKYADLVLEENSNLYNLANTTVSLGVYDLASVPNEILWTGALKEDNSETLYSSFVMAFSFSNGFANTYQQDLDGSVKDLRTGGSKGSYLVQNPNGEPAYADKSFAAFYGGGIRVSEVYLNRAEAYIRKYMTTGNSQYGMQALADLNQLRLNRFATGYVNKVLASYANPTDLLNFCWRERRRELVMEANHRWFDLRRQGMPKIEHVFFFEEGIDNITYTLEEKDSRYMLPIPAKVLELNPKLTQN